MVVPTQKKAVVLLSGGLDSSANLAIEKSLGHHVTALFINYGQRALKGERLAVEKLASHFKIELNEVALPFLGEWSQSALNKKNKELPKIAAKADLDDMDKSNASAAQVWVPNRNGLMIAVAAAFAESHQIGRVVVGFNKEEAATFPDNTAEFITRSNDALGLSCLGKVRVFCHTISMDKTQIVNAGSKLGLPFNFIWSCYSDSDKPCGECESCSRLARALEKAKDMD